MNIDLNAIVSTIGEDNIAKIAGPLGLDKDKAMQIVQSLAANFSGDRQAAVDGAHAQTGVDHDTLHAVFEQVMAHGGNDAVAAIAQQAEGAAKGFFGKIFGAKT